MKLGPLEIQGRQLLVADQGSSGILSFVQLGANSQSLAGGGVGDQLDDNFMTNQRSSSPVLRNVAEHAMLDLVPLAGSRRKMADSHRNAQTRSHVL